MMTIVMVILSHVGLIVSRGRGVRREREIQFPHVILQLRSGRESSGGNVPIFPPEHNILLVISRNNPDRFSCPSSSLFSLVSICSPASQILLSDQ